MSLAQTKVVDFISIGRKDGVVNLTLVDPLDWSDEGYHLILLEEKINTYLQFIENGEMEHTYPASVGRKRSINIVAQYEPTKRGFEFLNYAQSMIEKAGFNFRFELRNYDSE